jgi:hypothetical protein
MSHHRIPPFRPDTKRNLRTSAEPFGQKYWVIHMCSALAVEGSGNGASIFSAET